MTNTALCVIKENLCSGLTSAGVLLALPAVLTGVGVAGCRWWSRPAAAAATVTNAAAAVHAKHPPAVWPRPLGRPDILAVEPQPLQAAHEALGGGELGGRRGKDEGGGVTTAGTNQTARPGEGGEGRAVLVQAQPHGGAVDLYQDGVPAAVRQRLRLESQGGGGASTAGGELQLPVGQLKEKQRSRGQKVAGSTAGEVIRKVHRPGLSIIAL